MASFDGATFKERPQGQLFPTWGRKADVTVTHIPGPGSTKNIIESSGVVSDRLSLAIRCTESELNALRSKVDTSGTLIFSRGSRTAFLEEIENPAEVGAGGKFFATLKFIGQ